MQVYFSKREWYLLIEGSQEGPFTAKEVQSHPFVHLDTLAKKKRWPLWKLIRNIPELRVLIEGKRKKRGSKWLGEGKEAALTTHFDPGSLLLWVVIGVIVLFYIVYVFWRSKPC